jgi:ParB family chromosome partitioning protein
MKDQEVTKIPIAEIRVSNPRSRDKLIFQGIVKNIETIGLKRPITVTKRDPAADGTRYDLVCGQGRIEAFLALGQDEIPAIIIEAGTEERFLMSLVENIARRVPRDRDIIREIKSLRDRSYQADDIARKLGMDKTYIYGIIRLIDHGEDSLVAAVEHGKLPISVAIIIVKGTNTDLQLALAEAYEKGQLRGHKLTTARKIMAQRLGKQGDLDKETTERRRMSVEDLVSEYKKHTHRQRVLIGRANIVHDRFLLIVACMRRLLADDHFVTLLRAEQLSDLPESLVEQLA